MQQNVAFASEAKERLFTIFEVLKNFAPSGQIDECGGNQIICYCLWKGKV